MVLKAGFLLCAVPLESTWRKCQKVKFLDFKSSLWTFGTNFWCFLIKITRFYQVREKNPNFQTFLPQNDGIYHGRVEFLRILKSSFGQKLSFLQFQIFKKSDHKNLQKLSFCPKTRLQNSP